MPRKAVPLNAHAPIQATPSVGVHDEGKLLTLRITAPGFGVVALLTPLQAQELAERLSRLASAVIPDFATQQAKTAPVLETATGKKVKAGKSAARLDEPSTAPDSPEVATAASAGAKPDAIY